MSVLVAYTTRQGSTQEVATAIAVTLARRGLVVDLRAAAEVDTVEPYDNVVLGAAIYVGRLHEQARAFLNRHGPALRGRRLALFAMGPRTLTAEDIASSRAQLESALSRMPVEPELTTVFGGVTDTTKLRFPLNKLHAPDGRDWGAIRDWACEVADVILVRAMTQKPDGAHVEPPTVDRGWRASWR